MTEASPIGVVFIQGGGAGAYDEDAKLADSLRRELGDGFTVEYPRMPREDEPDYDRWRSAIGDALHRIGRATVVVGHSIGGYLLLRYLVTERIDVPIIAICSIAAPFPGGDSDWTYEGFDLPDRFAERLPADAAVLLYACEDDQIVPFAHRDVYAAAIPRAVPRTAKGGHQLGNDLSIVAADIRRIVDGPRPAARGA